MARKAIAVQDEDEQLAGERKPLNNLGSDFGSTAAVSVSVCAPPQDAIGSVALTFVPSIVPSEADFPVEMRRLFPDCEICNGEPNAAATAELHASACPASLCNSTFQVPSTEIGAASLLPERRTPAKASRGKPTRRTYATTKLRLVRDMKLNPEERIKKGSPAQSRASSKSCNTTPASAKAGG